MDPQDALRIAVESLWAHKLRTLLTLLGVVIGVASVIAVVTLMNGANQYVATRVNRYGADVFTASQTPGFITSYADFVRYNKRKVLTLDDYRAVRSDCGRCPGVGALVSTTGKIVFGKESSTDTTIRGITSLMNELQNNNIVEGRDLTQADEDHAARVAIIGSDIEDNLLKGDDPIGKEIHIDGIPYTVIGLGERQGKTLGQSQDNWVALPITAWQKTYGTQTSPVIYSKAQGQGPHALEAAGDDVRVILRSRRHDRPGDPDSFTIQTSDTLVGLWNQISGSFAAVAVAVAGVSLVVGGIVIMNIMLVSVTERTREIGIRKALGARRRDVLLQFLFEAGVVALLGGVLGVLGGVGAAKIVTAWLNFPSAVALWSVFAGLLVAVSVGLFFGVYPARKAAELDPIIALRSEF